jgi:putative transposase
MSPLLKRGHVRALQNCDCRKLPVAAMTLVMNWPHAPAHWLFEPGLYIVTAGTYGKLPHLNSPMRLDLFQRSLFKCAREFGWNLRAWAILANHYHFVALSPSSPRTLRKFLGKLHMQTARQLNLWDGTLGRKVWFQFWDSHITYERSYLARLNYVHYNPARHGVVPRAENYRWCSAPWFAENAPPVFVNTVKSFKIDRVNVPDDF